MKGCLAEASEGIRAEFHPTLEQLEMVGCSMKAKEEEVERISRVAENPVRKLGRHDRLTGAAMYCLKHGIEPVNIARPSRMDLPMITGRIQMRSECKK